MKKRASYILGLFAWLFCSSFEPNWQYLFSIEREAKIIETDRMGNIFLVSKTNQLYKYNAQGILQSTLNYAYLGNISQIDASNPLEIYLFYRELNALVFLDNNLAFRGRLNLSDVGIIQASTAARSYSNGIWVFDQGDLQLKKLEKDGTLAQASGNALQFANHKNLSASRILDNGDKIYVNDSSEGVMVFDLFANYLKTIPIKGKEEIKIMGENLFFIDKRHLISYQLKRYQRDTLLLPQSDNLGFSLEKEKLYLLNEKGLRIYQFKAN